MKFSKLKQYLGAGLITLLPIALTVMIIVWIFNFLTTPFLGITEDLLFSYQKFTGINLENHTELAIFLSRLLSLIFLLVLMFILGFFGKKYFFDTLMQYGNRLVMRIPFVNTIYRISKDVTRGMIVPGSKAFKKTILIAFPHKEAHTLAFVTGDVPPSCQKPGLDLKYTVFVPTSPHPFSGFILFSPEKNITQLNMTTEEAFKYILSCGIVNQEETPPKS